MVSGPVTVEPDTDALDRVAELLGDRAEAHAPLGALTTYKVGGRARLRVRIDSLDDLRAVAAAIRTTNPPVLVVGRGSNLLVADDGFDGLALVFGEGFATIDIGQPSGADGTIPVTAGGYTLLPVLARRTVAAGLTGLEWAVGVPGSVGGAVRMNAGGHGSDVAARLVTVHLFDVRTGHDGVVPAAALHFRFRGSDLADHQVVVAATFRLAAGDRAHGEQELAEIVRWRREHQPGGQNAGSVFVNPIPGQLSAGEVIDSLGLRGHRVGSAFVSEKHANFIQATDGGSADDVKALIEDVRGRVLEESGLLLRSEIRLVGFPDASPSEPGVRWS
jgi:UDP-N-acetylmuramate dehydrogenase